MPTFITIGYGDQAGYERTAANRKATAHEHDAALLARGALIAQVGVPIQVRNHDGEGVQTKPGSFMQSDLPVAGVMVIEAVSLESAIELVSETPCAIAYGVVEVWPLVGS